MTVTDQDKTCSTCHWYAPFEGVCCNGSSEHRADFMEPEAICTHWNNYGYETYSEEDEP